jgi:hypothetical protein
MFELVFLGKMPYFFFRSDFQLYKKVNFIIGRSPP